MESKEWKRARTKEQKSERIEAILSAAEKVYAGTPFHNVTLLMIAKEAGVTRTNIYRYFKSREEIFAELYVSDLDHWIEAVFLQFTEHLTITAFIAEWTQVLLEQRRLLEMTPLLPAILKAVGQDKKEEVELKIEQSREDILMGIQKALPQITPKQCDTLLKTHQVVVAGSLPLMAPEKLTYSEPLFSFQQFYAHTLMMYLKGVLKEGE